MTSATGGFAIRCSWTTTQPLLLQGEAGWSRKGPAPEQASHYYSQPQLDVIGTLTWVGPAHPSNPPGRGSADSRPAPPDDGMPVRGRGWLDHEWSDSLLPPGAVGWDWIGMNLDDGSSLTAFRLRRADGSSVYAGGSHRPGGTADRPGTVRSFGAQEVEFRPGRRWTSPHSNTTYPVEWDLSTPVGRFKVRAMLDDQELDSRRSTGTIYWEGLSELLDVSGHRVGRGYLEMTGYSGRLALG